MLIVECVGESKSLRTRGVCKEKQGLQNGKFFQFDGEMQIKAQIINSRFIVPGIQVSVVNFIVVKRQLSNK